MGRYINVSVPISSRMTVYPGDPQPQVLWPYWTRAKGDPAKWTWRQSVLGNLRLIDKRRPKRAYMIHYSGYEDREHTGDSVSGPLA